MALDLTARILHWCAVLMLDSFLWLIFALKSNLINGTPPKRSLYHRIGGIFFPSNYIRICFSANKIQHEEGLNHFNQSFLRFLGFATTWGNGRIFQSFLKLESFSEGFISLYAIPKNCTVIHFFGIAWSDFQSSRFVT